MRRAGNVQPDEAMTEMGDLPEGWASASLGEIALPSTEKAEPSDRPDCPYLSLEHIESGTNSILGRGLASETTSTKAVFRAGDVLYGKLRPYLNKVAIPDFDGVCSTDILVFPPGPAVDSRFLMRFLSLPKVVEFAEHTSTGNSLPRTSFEKLSSLPLPLPPLAEQKRIVAKVEELLARQTTARERLAKVPKLLKAFRQSVLAAACSGRLTKDWRDERKLAESVDDLLRRITVSRSKVAKQIGVGMPPNPEYDTEVPSSWALTSMDRLCSRITSGSRDWRQFYREDGSGTFVMAQNVRPLFFDRSFRLAVQPPEDNRDRERSEIRQADLLVTIIGANTGDVCRVAAPVHEHYVCQSVALMRPAIPDISAYLELYHNSPSHGQAQYADWIYGEGRPHLGFEHLKATAIMLPPLEEQHEIVRRVESLFNLADAIEKRLSAATLRTEKLAQSILAKAFRGELVPTEAELARIEGRDYEPAAALLDRISREREVSDTKSAIDTATTASRTKRKRKAE